METLWASVRFRVRDVGRALPLLRLIVDHCGAACPKRLNQTHIGRDHRRRITVLRNCPSDIVRGRQQIADRTLICGLAGALAFAR